MNAHRPAPCLCFDQTRRPKQATVGVVAMALVAMGAADRAAVGVTTVTGTAEEVSWAASSWVELDSMDGYMHGWLGPLVAHGLSFLTNRPRRRAGRPVRRRRPRARQMYSETLGFDSSLTCLLLLLLLLGWC